jgi:hypothetical protein
MATFSQMSAILEAEDKLTTSLTVNSLSFLKLKPGARGLDRLVVPDTQSAGARSNQSISRRNIDRK